MTAGSGWVKDRPFMPGSGAPESLEGTREWEPVARLIASAKNYWVCSASASGEPHAVPMWAVFLDDTFYIGAAGVKTLRNLAENPRICIHLESGDDVVIADGTIEPEAISDAALVKAIGDQYVAKYNRRPGHDHEDGSIGGGWKVLKPTRILAWSSFPTDTTRWTRRTDR